MRRFFRPSARSRSLVLGARREGGGCSVGLGPGYAGWPRVLRRARKAEANLGYFFFSC